MGVSFQVAKTGTRYRPKLLPTEEKDSSENDSGSDPQQRENEVNCTGMGAKVAADPSSVLVNLSEDFEVSFSLKLFENGFNVGKANELLNGVPEHLHPYDRASEKLFTAIECGWLPGDVFDALPCKYVNGAILCEIQDYRSCLIQERVTVPTNKVPSVHKVLLHMCAENVVKDILSISNNSWTYRDFLEVESQIVKALQPALHLNPQPLQDIYSGESLRKKINLGIMWSWKRRKLSNASDTDIGFNNSHHVADITVNCATQSCSSLAGLSYQERGITFSEHNVVRENSLSTRKQPSSRELGNSLSNLLTSQPTSKAAYSCSQASLPMVAVSDFATLPKPSLNYSNNGLGMPGSSALDKRVRCETQAVQAPMLKKPKPEPVDFSYQQLTGSQAETSLLPYLQWKKKLLHQPSEGGKVIHERIQEKVRPLAIINNGQTRSFQGISELQAAFDTSNVKLEPEKDSFPSSNFRKTKNEHRVMDRIPVQSYLQQSQKQQSSSQLRDNVSTNMRMHRSVSQLRTGSDIFQVAAPENCASASSPNITFLPSEVVVPPKQKTDPRPKRSRKKTDDSSASMGNTNAADANHVSMNLTSSRPSRPKAGSFPESFLKIQAVTERYGLHNREYKLDPFLRRKPFSSVTPLVSYQLLSSGDDKKWENTSADKISLKECFLDRGIGIYETRTLTFLRQSHIHQENETPIVDREAQVRLIISEKLNEGMMKASVAYGIEKEMFSIDHPLLPASTSTHSAYLLATQFTTLMKHEGYYLASYHVGPISPKADEGFSSQWHSATISATPSARPIALPSSTLTPRLSPSGLSPISMQRHSQNIFSGGQFLPPEIIQLAAQLPDTCIPKQALSIATQENCMMPQVRQILNNCAYSMYQTLQIQQQQQRNQFMQGGSGGGGESASGLGMIERGGVQGLGNSRLGLLGNGMGLRSSTPPTELGGRMPWVGNVGLFNNLGSEVSSLNDSKLPLGPVSDLLRATEGQGKALMTGVSVDITNSRGMTTKLSNQQLLQLQMHPLEMRSLFEQRIQPEIRSLVEQKIPPQMHPPELESSVQQQIQPQMYQPGLGSPVGQQLQRQMHQQEVGSPVQQQMQPEMRSPVQLPQQNTEQQQEMTSLLQHSDTAAIVVQHAGSPHCQVTRHQQFVQSQQLIQSQQRNRRMERGLWNPGDELAGLWLCGK
ncbi:hypothetical protein ACFX1Z_020585 [Malus domestica]